MPIRSAMIRLFPRLSGALLAVLGATSGRAALIISESFQTTASGTGGTYDADVNLGASPNPGVVVGNVGFANSAGKLWVNNTAGAIAHLSGLTHAFTPGTSASGAVRVGNLSGAISRRVHRVFAGAPPLSTDYYLGGLVNLGASTNLAGVTQSMGGITTAAGTAVDSFDISTGIHYGLRRDALGDIYLTTAAGNTFRDLVKITVADTTYQVVLRLQTSTSGNELLSAWYAPAGATSLTLGFADLDVGNIFSGTSSLGALLLQTRNQNGSSNSGKTVLFDEIRFGTAPADVTTAFIAVPEPATFASLAGGVAAALAFARRRRRSARPR